MKRFWPPLLALTLIVLGVIAYNTKGYEVDPHHKPGRVLFHGYISSANASAPADESAARIPLYAAGTNTAIVIAATEHAVITDVTTSSIAALVAWVFDGAVTNDNVVDAGETVAVRSHSSLQGGGGFSFKTPHVCAVGTYPKFKTSATGQVYLSVHGYIAATGTLP